MPFFCFAQKLPNKQEVSLWAPKDIQANGKVDEWHNTFMAYNHQVDLFYSIANDDDNIYFVIHSAIPVINRKIMNYGISITLNVIEKKEKSGITVSYPYLTKAERSAALQIMMRSGAISSLKDGATVQEEQAYWKRRDSLMAITDSKILTLFKNVKIEGIKEIGPIIATDNQFEVKVAALPTGHDFNYELAIPKKYLGTLADGQTIHYQIKLSGPPPNDAGTGTLIVVDGGSYVNQDGIDLRSLSTHTDFWGEYKMAKRP